MKYSQKVFFLFAAMGIIIAVISFSFYYNHKIQVYEKEEQAVLKKQAEQIGNKMNTAVEQMEFAISFILSDIDVLNGMKILVSENKRPEEKYDVAEAIRSIRINLGAWYLNRNFSNVIVFNKDGTAITKSGKLNEEFVKSELKEQNYQEMTEHKKQGRIIRSVHPSNWDDSNKHVISMVQEVKGYQGTYIEVEYDITKLELPDDISYIIHDSQGNPLIDNIQNSNDQEIINSFSSSLTGIKASVLADGKILKSKARMASYPDVIIILVFIIVILIFVQLSTRYLTKPIIEISDLIEKKDIENLRDPFVFHSNIKEVESLGKSFDHLLKRLDHSLELENRAVKLQMQAQFDALQAGVNPHFIFNVLNIIANRGMKANDDMICRICSKLGAILRYSTNTREREAPVSEEIQYLKNYFFLIRERFKEDFTYEFMIDKDMENMMIPKLGLQQLAENSIKHGFGGSKMNVVVRGEKLTDGWLLAIQDDGCGFQEEKLKNVRMKIEEARNELLCSQPGFEIGGMGIVNTYLRFFLIYGERLSFNIENNDIGALVTVKICQEDK